MQSTLRLTVLSQYARDIALHVETKSAGLGLAPLDSTSRSVLER